MTKKRMVYGLFFFLVLVFALSHGDKEKPKKSLEIYTIGAIEFQNGSKDFLPIKEEVRDEKIPKSLFLLPTPPLGKEALEFTFVGKVPAEEVLKSKK